MKHTHHIIPRHAGGTDDPSNLIELTVEEHAEEHRKLWEQYGREEDRIAWLSLSGQITKKEACLLGYKLGRNNSNKKLEEIYGPEWRKIISKKGNEIASIKGTRYVLSPEELALGRNKSLSLESKRKRLETFSKIEHQKGEKNSQYGTIWITNGETNKKIKFSDNIPYGWNKGRIVKKKQLRDSSVVEH